jgi:GT2 family glycosyltransferase
MVGKLPAFSLIVCSIDDRKLDVCLARYRSAIAPFPLEIIAIRDARSLAEAYNRALARATGDIVILSHDDAWPLSPDCGARLAAHLAAVDVIGIAGATRAITGFWAEAGQPDTHGHIVTPDEKSGEIHVWIFGAETPRIEGIRILDGCFMAARRDVALATGFDAECFDGFHLYDADFTLRAHAAGRRVGVAADITVFHQSEGTFDGTWQRYHQRFLAKHAALLDAGPRHQRRIARLTFGSLEEAAAGVDAAKIARLTPDQRGAAHAAVRARQP